MDTSTWTLAQLKQVYGATHYSVMKDGVTPQMVYKQIDVPFNDGTVRTWWHYLSYANIWMGSSMKEEHIADLKLIE